MCSSEDTIADKQSCTQTDRPTHHNTNNTLFPYRGQSNKIINLQICILIAPRISHHNTMTITKQWQISNDHNEHTLVPTKTATADSRLRPWNIISHTRGRGHSSGFKAQARRSKQGPTVPNEAALNLHSIKNIYCYANRIDICAVMLLRKKYIEVHSSGNCCN